MHLASACLFERVFCMFKDEEVDSGDLGCMFLKIRVVGVWVLLAVRD